MSDTNMHNLGGAMVLAGREAIDATDPTSCTCWGCIEDTFRVGLEAAIRKMYAYEYGLVDPSNIRANLVTLADSIRDGGA